MFCSNCGRKLTGAEIRCPGCGAAIPKRVNTVSAVSLDVHEPKGMFVFAAVLYVLGLLIPVIFKRVYMSELAYGESYPITFILAAVTAIVFALGGALVNNGFAKLYNDNGLAVEYSSPYYITVLSIVTAIVYFVFASFSLTLSALGVFGSYVDDWVNVTQSVSGAGFLILLAWTSHYIYRLYAVYKTACTTKTIPTYKLSEPETHDYYDYAEPPVHRVYHENNNQPQNNDDNIMRPGGDL